MMNMDMDHKAAKPFLPIINEPVMFHSSRDPGNCTLTPEQCAYKSRYWVFWYKADLVYCLPVVYFFITAIALFTIGRFASEYAPASVKRSNAWRRSVSLFRFLSYKNWRIGTWNSQSLGVCLLGAVGVVFFSALTLGPKPYYWPTDAKYGNSPPIATRTGWMALACLPFILAFGAKANMVSALTGIPPEKLNIWHNWASWAMFVLALIHTFPFIIYHEYKGDLVKTWQTGGVWLTGVVALIAQAWLTFMSVSWIRNRWYEFFKTTHYFFALTFVIFFFLHCSFRMTSWDYFIAAAAIYLTSLLYGFAKTYGELGVHSASLRLETPHSLRISITTNCNWKPGQHVYLRFLTFGVHALSAHPLTICSVPHETTFGSEMIFYVQPRGGLTRRLATLAKKKPDTSVNVLMEGPYGGMPARWYKGFDRTLLVAGGSGSAFSLSLIEDWLQRRNDEPKSSTSKKELKVILATRDAEMRIWYTEELQRIAERRCDAQLSEIPNLAIHFYETHETTATNSPILRRSLEIADSASSSGAEEEKVAAEPTAHGYPSSTVSLFGIKFFRGRPDTGAAVRELALQETDSTVGVTVCGPSGMVYDVSAEATSQQERIVRGRPGASELWFHREAFSY